MDLGETVWSAVDWIGLTQDRGKWRVLVNSVSTFEWVHKWFSLE
jgi:hypothetical protein